MKPDWLRLVVEENARIKAEREAVEARLRGEHPIPVEEIEPFNPEDHDGELSPGD